jgi:hypothetical protein
MIEDCRLKSADGSAIHACCEMIHTFPDPVFSGAAHGTWNPDTWKWKRP